MAHFPKKFLVNPKLSIGDQMGRWKKTFEFGRTAGELRAYNPPSGFAGSRLLRLARSPGTRRLVSLAALGGLGYGYYKGISLVLAEEQALHHTHLQPVVTKESPLTTEPVAQLSSANMFWELIKGLSHAGVAAGSVAVAGVGVAGVVLMVVLNGIVHYIWLRTLRDPQMTVLDEILARGAFPSDVVSPPSVISPILFFDTPLNIEAIREQVETKLARYKRFSSVPIPNPNGLGWIWKQVPVDARQHVIIHTVRSDAELRRLLEHVTLNPLRNPHIPRWEVHVISNVGSGKSALIPRLDHCIGDGISLANVFQDLTTDRNGNATNPLPAFKRKDKSFMPSISRIFSLFHSIGDTLSLPFTRTDTKTVFGPSVPADGTQPQQTIVKLPEISLPLVKLMKTSASVTVNDILMAAFSGAVARYLDDIGDTTPPELRAMRALVPIAFPRENLPEDRKWAFGLQNNWSFASLPLAVSESTRLKRLQKTEQLTSYAKSSPSIFLQKTLQDTLYYLLPIQASRQACFDLMSKHSVCFSNVPGPQQPLQVAGVDIAGVEVVFPNIMPQVSLLSYNGVVYGNLIVDRGLITQPEHLAALYGEEVRRLAMALGVDPNHR